MNERPADQSAPLARGRPGPLSAPVPRAAAIISVYHAIILIAGLIITTYVIGPQTLVRCADPSTSSSSNGPTAVAAESMCSQNHLHVLIFALCFGFVGSALNASRYVVLAVRHRRYDNDRILWQILTPLHGGVLAVVAVYVVVGGLFSVAQGSNVGPAYGYFIGGFSFLVGFSSELFVKRLIAATEALFGEGSTGKQHETVESLSDSPGTNDDSR